MSACSARSRSWRCWESITRSRCCRCFFEFVWKSIWVLALGLPLLLSGQLDRNASFGGTETLINCLLGIVLVPLVTPWGYVLKHYWKAPGDRWGKLVTVRPLPSDKPKIVA